MSVRAGARVPPQMLLGAVAAPTPQLLPVRKGRPLKNAVRCGDGDAGTGLISVRELSSFVVEAKLCYKL